MVGAAIRIGTALFSDPRRALQSVGGLLKNPFILAILLLSWTAYQRHDAASTARASCENAQLRADMAELARQLAARDRLVTEFRERADASADRLKALEKERADILEQLKSGDSCEFPPDVLRRLRNIS